MPKVYGDKWETVETLPEGGQAFTYVVRLLDSDDARKYVLKRLKNPERIGRFRNEIEAGLRLSHKNIVEIVDSDLDAPQPFIVTVYCEGGSWQEAMPFNYSDYGRLLDLFGQVCDAVIEAHSKEVIHRDLKPENIFLWGDRHGDAVVGDFGLCFLGDDPRLTGSAEAVGPRNYMAPELEDGRLEEVSVKSDVYSLGKLLYWLISGGGIFSREKHREPEFDLVELSGDPYMEHINRLLDRMVVLDPNERFPLQRLRQGVADTKRLVVGEYNPVGPSVQARCNYCGTGRYALVGRDRSTAAEAYFISAGHPGDWRILVCNQCGHCQTFRPDIVRKSNPTRPTPWDEPPK